MIKSFLKIAALVLCVGILAQSVSAQQFSSTGYKVTDPVIFPGGYGNSTHFGLTGVISQMAIGTSTSSSFKAFAGFLYFPFVSTPTVSATGGDTQVALTWTSADASGGWAVSGYSVGKASASGGPYTYTNVGNVLSSTATGLSNGTTYYFVIQVIDALGNHIATSSEVSAAAVGSSNNGGGGGGGGGSTPPVVDTNTGVILSGRAYPLSKVHFLKDGQTVLSTIAGPDSKFSARVTSLTAGSYIFSVYGEDNQGVTSSLFTFPITVTSGVITSVGGIFIAPTVSLDKSEVRKGDTIAIFGQAHNSSEVTIQTHSNEGFFSKTGADKDGAYLYNFDTTPLEMGNHTTKLKAAFNGEISSYSKELGFIVGTKNVAAVISQKCKRGDLNCDGRVNLVDFSIAAFWYKKTLSSTFKVIEAARLNNDGKINLVDFSIMAFNWTG